MSCLETRKVGEGSEADHEMLMEEETNLKPKPKRTRRRKKSKGKSVKIEKYVDEEKEMLKDPKIKQQLDEYLRRYKETEGFDVPDPPFGTFLCIAPEDDLEHPKLIKWANFAVDEQNKREGKKMQFVKVIKAMTQGVGGLLFYLTIEVKDDVRDSFICQAKVYYSFEETALDLFREVPGN